MGTSGSIRFKLLGDLRAWTGAGQALEFPNRKVGQLAAVMASTPGKIWDRKELAAIVWPESLGDSALASLRQGLSLLRKSIESSGEDPDKLIESSKTTLGFLKSAVTSDLAEFEVTLDLSAYSGLFVPAWESEWSDAYRVQLDGKYVSTLVAKCKELTQVGKSDVAYQLASRAVSQDPLNEDKVRLFMGHCMGQGDPGAAVRAFRSLERGLQTRLNLLPSVATIELARQAKRMNRRRPALPASNARTSLPKFLGRERMLEHLESSMSGGAIRFTTLVGTGGVGKTRLATEVSARVALAGKMPVWFVDLSATYDSEEIVPAVMEQVGFDGSVTRDLAGLAFVTGDSPALLVLDNLEQIGPGAGQIIESVLGACPGVIVLATSREATGSQAETSVRVDPLPTPEAGDFGPSLPSFQLFVEQARVVGVDIPVQDYPSVANIVRRLEGLPLAICLAAAQSQTKTAEEIVTGLDEVLTLLETDDDRFVERHQKLRACIDWSHRMYPETHQLLKLLAVFRGGFSLSVVKFATNDPALNSSMQSLVRSSLIFESGRSGSVRFDMYETVREFIVEQTSDEEASELSRVHAEAMRNWMDSDKTPQYDNRDRYLRDKKLEYENLRKAFEWSLTHDPPLSLDIVSALGYYWWSRDLFREGKSWIERAIEANPPGKSTAYASAHRILGSMYTGLTEYKKAYEVAHLGLGFFPEDTSLHQISKAYNTLGNAAANFDSEVAKECFRKAIDLAQQAGDDLLGIPAIGNYGFALHINGELDEAETWLVKAIEVSRKINNADWVGQNLHNYGLIAMARGDNVEAERRFAESRSSVAGTDVDPARRGWLVDAGLAALRLGKVDEAFDLIVRGTDGIYQSKGIEAYVDSIEAMAEWCESTGDNFEAAALLSASTRLGTPAQRSKADRSPTALQRLALLKSKLSPSVFRSAARRYDGFTVEDILEEVVLYERASFTVSTGKE
ncbi:MAG: hypothetical protein JNM34_08800 [Chthonomonadaceae bacterium]|nr:hypothetical protein [Chthonomonadaceae bacterium]